MSTIAIQAKVTNTDASNPLTLLGANLGCMVSEIRIYCAGVELERVQFLNRLETLLERILPWDKRVAVYDAGFGYASGNINRVFASTPLSASYGKCSSRPDSCLEALGSGCLVIELTLVGSASDCVVEGSGKST